MCEGSIHVAHRLATDKERLVIQKVPGHGGYKGTYPFIKTDTDNKLVCIRKLTRAVIKQVRFEQGILPAIEKTYAGKRNIVVTMDRYSILTFPNGMQFTMHGLKEGVRIDVGIPVRARKPKGMTVVEKAIKEAMATADSDPTPPQPKDKPEDKPGNPNPGEGKPAEHPGQGEPTPHPQPHDKPEREPA